MFISNDYAPQKGDKTWLIKERKLVTIFNSDCWRCRSVRIEQGQNISSFFPPEDIEYNDNSMEAKTINKIQVQQKKKNPKEIRENSGQKLVITKETHKTKRKILNIILAIQKDDKT